MAVMFGSWGGTVSSPLPSPEPEPVSDSPPSTCLLFLSLGEGEGEGKREGDGMRLMTKEDEGKASTKLVAAGASVPSSSTIIGSSHTSCNSKKKLIGRELLAY